MSEEWQSLLDEIARWHDLGRVADFWWRDDDAAQPTPAFTRLAALSHESGTPLGLAVIPDAANAALFEQLPAEISVLQHGYDHRNRAPQGEKACEFPPGMGRDWTLQRLARGHRRLKELAGDRLLPVLVPPWNRFPSALLDGLPPMGLIGYSTFASRACASPVAGLRQTNTHVDVINWRQGRKFIGEERALSEAVAHLAARRTGIVDASEPTGWLTHHACHEEALWTFLRRLFERTRGVVGCCWLTPAQAILHASRP